MCDKNNAAPCGTAVGPWSDLALHTIGWRAFQDLCSQVCEVVLHRTVEVFREAQDGGQDAVFLISGEDGTDDTVGTVQCKHCSDPQKALTASDLTPEIEHLGELVRQGQADTYVLMTNMSVDARVAMRIRTKMRELGVRKPHVLGRQFIIRAVKESPRLRALVPQVYGLGDISILLDQRLADQSRVLLEEWVPKLKSYVPTGPHRRAVHALYDHSVVLLLGNPSSGKSAIGAILSTIASEDPKHSVMLLSSPKELDGAWNPHDSGRFFWIDDAFGSNTLRADYVQDWTTGFRKVQAAIAKGNKFVLTSRRHIYEGAKRRLGERNLPAFLSEEAVVDVGRLTPEEREKILYNHINYGRQSQQWKTAVKAHLESVANVQAFLPGIAERLGNPAFTKGLALREPALVRFMQEPREHLIDTINALDDAARASLLLVYVHQGKFDQNAPDKTATDAVVEVSSLPLPQILDRLPDLRGSFVKRATGEHVWTFAHPTIADALTETLREKPHMASALLRGATIETILSGFICEGVVAVRDAMVVPAAQEPMLIKRLTDTPNETQRNWSLFSFLAYRASDDFVRGLITAAPQLLSRHTYSTEWMNNDPRVNTWARVHALGLLSEDLRDEAASQLQMAAADADLSYFDDSKILALIPPPQLVALGIRLRGQMLPALGEKVGDLADEADLDEDPEAPFGRVRDALHRLEDMTQDEGAEELISITRDQIRSSVQTLTERKEERDSEREKDDDDWGQLLETTTRNVDATPAPAIDSRPRSIFDDVDQS